jgi:hypothetical protein
MADGDATAACPAVAALHEVTDDRKVVDPADRLPA